MTDLVDQWRNALSAPPATPQDDLVAAWQRGLAVAPAPVDPDEPTAAELEAAQSPAQYRVKPSRANYTPLTALDTSRALAHGALASFGDEATAGMAAASR